MKALELKDQKFGRLLVKEEAKKRDKHGVIHWVCQCDCGNITEIAGRSLIRGLTKSCGCLNSEMVVKRNFKHGHAETKIYRIWVSLQNRCNNPNNNGYKNYGGRGIKVCERWNDFRNFLADMGERPEGLTIERKDNNKGYSPDNCIWATFIEQTRNSRVTKLNPLRVKNIKQCLAKGVLTRKTLGYIFGVSKSTIGNIATDKSWSDIGI